MPLLLYLGLLFWELQLRHAAQTRGRGLKTVVHWSSSVLIFFCSRMRAHLVLLPLPTSNSLPKVGRISALSANPTTARLLWDLTRLRHLHCAVKVCSVPRVAAPHCIETEDLAEAFREGFICWKAKGRWRKWSMKGQVKIDHSVLIFQPTQSHCHTVPGSANHQLGLNSAVFAGGRSFELRGLG